MKKSIILRCPHCGRSDTVIQYDTHIKKRLHRCSYCKETHKHILKK